MNVSPQATPGHLIVGAALVAIALACAIGGLARQLPWLALLVFFFGVWGGVELGRYLEHWLTTRTPQA